MYKREIKEINSIPSRKWKKLYKCKKGKGDHTFEAVYGAPSLFLSRYYVQYVCTTCGKNKIEWDL